MDVLLIKTKALIPAKKLAEFRADFVKQLESGVVIIPAYFEAEILNVPDDVEVILESGSVIGSEFMSKEFNI